jgi:hypothetical protein
MKLKLRDQTKHMKFEIEDNPNGRLSQWKLTSMEDDFKKIKIYTSA